MELNFEEINNLDKPTNNHSHANSVERNESTNPVKYWEQPALKKKENQRKKVTFDDILNNMNLVVRPDGMLQYMTPLTKENPNYQQQVPQPQTQPQYNNEPLNPSVKHSYIYNKYFKDYKEGIPQQEGPKRPKTIQELKQMLREKKIKEIQQKIRIAQMKPKNMLFTNVGGMHMTKNSLRTMAFK
jgi:hypothetical protein